MSERVTGSIDSLFEPSSIAIVGASERAGSLGAALLSNVSQAGFAGPVYPVNPRYRSVAGRRCCASLREIGTAVDLAVIATPANTVPRILEDCGVAGIRAAVILSAGFSEIGDAGSALERECLDVAARHGIRFLGPNCLGVMRPRIGLNASFSQTMALPGRVALVSQSGAICTAMLDWAAPNGVGFSCVVSSGIAADVDFGDVLDFLVSDAQTGAVMLYIEGVRDARGFMSALRALARAKPVVVMKAGRHDEGRRAAAAHTGALVGSDLVFDAALRRAGVVRVFRYADFFEVARTLHAGVRTAGPRLAIVTNGGGPAVLAADAAADASLALPSLAPETRRRLDDLLPAAWSHANPVDVLGDADAERFAGAVRICLDAEEVDAVLVIFVPQALVSPEQVAKAIVGLTAQTTKLVIGCWMGEATMRNSRELLEQGRVAHFATPESAVRAFKAAASYQANQALLLQIPEPAAPLVAPDRAGAELIIANALAADTRMLGLIESKALLKAFGIAVSPSSLARNAAEALALAEETGFPVAMKVASPDIAHKSDVGGVRLMIRGGRDVGPVFQDLVETVGKSRPGARIEGVTIEAMHADAGAREIMLGVINDSVFGPVLSVGLGGRMVEIIGDRAVGLPPLNRFLAAAMIDGTRAARYLQEFRGIPAADRAALEETLLKLSDMACELPWIEALDINPLLVGETGVVAVDARVELRTIGPSNRRYGHMAIHPYPVHLVGDHILRDGTRILIRPIRPEDGILERDFVNSLSDRSRYLRFMYALKQITPDMLSRFTRIDYDREMALVAIAGRDYSEKQIAVARYSVLPDRRSCEFAIVVADEWHGHGIATELLKRLIASAREQRLAYMVGHVLSENRNMIALAKGLGFTVSTVADEPNLVAVRLAL